MLMLKPKKMLDVLSRI